MKRFGLLGYPLGHTLSPQLHRLLAEQQGQQISYEIFPIPPEDFEQQVEQLFSLDGFNITIPYKVPIIERLDELDASARNHGAVNVVAVSEQGRRIGYNTDCIGFVKTMESHGVALEGRVCVLGAGGVGRMFATECALRGCEVVLAVREKSIGQAHQIAEHIRGLCPQASVQVQDIAKLTGSYSLMINATPCGMFPKMDAIPVREEVLAEVQTVFDCIYNPSQTLLMRQAAHAGCRVVGGLGMLVWQAAAAQEIWMGSSFAPEQIEQVIRRLEQ